MIRAETTLRVRYGETDRMGFAYYGAYAQYYEVARVEALRKLGLSYREMEERGVLLPVNEFHINYHKPAYYDDEVTVVCTIRELPSVKFTFHYECYNSEKVLLNSGHVTLVFMSKEKGRACPPPEWFMNEIKKYF